MGYYMGDPGFLSFLGGIAKKAVGFIPGVGGVLSTALEKSGQATTSHMGTALALRAGGMAKQLLAKHPTLTAAGAAAAAGGVAAAVHRMGGGTTKMHPAVRAAMGLGGHRRRMNVLNPKALRRSLRRAHGFARFAMKTIHLVHPKKQVTFGGFKKHRKRAA